MLSRTVEKKKLKEDLSDEEVSDFMDDESDEELIPIVPIKRSVCKSILPKRLVIDYIFANTKTYNFRTWSECFPDNSVRLRSLIVNPAWNEFFDKIEKKPYYENMERIISGYLKKKESIVPHAELVFNVFNALSPDQIQVVIIGQDPYPGANTFEKKEIPQAMGFSFSVPLNYPKPPSLNNIYSNLLEFGHIRKIPNGGCLASWILQGVFMMNSSLTTFIGNRNHPHKDLWKNFSADLIDYINKKCKNVVFLVWGKPAHLMCSNLDPYKHCIVTSSHPSPYAYAETVTGNTYGKNRKPTTYPSFKSTDHFGRMNEYLKSVGKKEIFLDLIDVNIIDT